MNGWRIAVNDGRVSLVSANDVVVELLVGPIGSRPATFEQRKAIADYLWGAINFAENYESET